MTRRLSITIRRILLPLTSGSISAGRTPHKTEPTVIRGLGAYPERKEPRTSAIPPVSAPAAGPNHRPAMTGARLPSVNRAKPRSIRRTLDRMILTAARADIETRINVFRKRLFFFCIKKTPHSCRKNQVHYTIVSCITQTNAYKLRGNHI